jgi:hypothetical protein
MLFVGNNSVILLGANREGYSDKYIFLPVDPKSNALMYSMPVL